MIQQQPTPKILQYIQQHIDEQEGDPSLVQILSLKNQKIPTVAYLNLLPNLKVIDLRNNLLVSMAGLELCLQLKQLYLCENRIIKITNIWHLPQLEILDVRGNHLIDLNSNLDNIPLSLTQLKARCNLISNIEQIAKMKNNLEVIWLDENRFLKNSKAFYLNIFLKKGLQLRDFWM